MTIKILDDLTISKIAAGEIIENPASIVKELIENSIDANSKNIVIEIKNSPWEYIKVSDDGDGIFEDEIEKAFMRHSTSKLSDFNDLENITSLGFRGEALASITSIAKVEILTKTKSDISGTRAVIENGKIIEKKKIGIPKGTTFYITDIFYNTPVRRKFLKKETTEFNYIMDVVKKISLGIPEISIKLIKDSRVVFSKIATDDLSNQVFAVLGSDISKNLKYITGNYEKYSIKAFFSTNVLYRASRSEQYIYINGRFIRNLEISKSIEKAYYSQIPLGRFPVFVVYIEIDPSIVDVNIHPKKHEVKFVQGEILVQILKDLAEDALLSSREIIHHDVDDKKSEKVNIFELYSEEKENEIIIPQNTKTLNVNNIQDNFQTNNEIEEKNYTSSNFLNTEYTIDNTTSTASEHTDDYAVEKTNPLKSLINSKYIGSLFNTYLIFEQVDDNWFLIDQHAAHERVKYEKYLEQFNNKTVDTQMLLKPEIYNLNSYETDKFDDFYEKFNLIGFDIEKFSDSSIIVRGIPSILDNKYEDFLRQTLYVIEENTTSAYQINPYDLMKRACKAAVKANEKLSIGEAQHLLKDLIDCIDPYTCPHGRPTILNLTKRDLEKMFLRG